MAKNRVKNRLQKLFSNIQPLEPEPLTFKTSIPNSEEDCLPAAVLPAGLEYRLLHSGSDNGAKPESTSEEGEQRQNGQPVNGHTSDEAIIYSVSHSGWEEYLDAINRRDQIGYVYDQAAVEESPAILGEENLRGSLSAAIWAGEEEIGQLLLGSNPNRKWTTEDEELVRAVSQQVAQQIETLRLLDEAQRSRSKAEEAYQHLARRSGYEIEAEEELLARLPGVNAQPKDENVVRYAYQDGEIISLQDDLYRQLRLQTG
jgi:GAF domain-containing protein